MKQAVSTILLLLVPLLLNAQARNAAGENTEDSYISQLVEEYGHSWIEQLNVKTDTDFFGGYLSVNTDNSEWDFVPVEQVGKYSYSVYFPEMEPEADSVRSGEEMLLERVKGFESRSKEEQVELFRKLFEDVLKEEQNDSRKEKPVQPEMSDLDGIILDETRSKTGAEFYSFFYVSWTKPDWAANYTVRISEKPGPGLGSIVYVEVNNENIFEIRLQPGDRRIRQAGEYAVGQTLEFLKENPSNYTIY